MQHEFDMRVERSGEAPGAVGLERADALRVMDQLAVQVGERDAVIVDDAQRADAGAGEIGDDGTAQPAGPHDQHAGALQRLLAGAAHALEHQVAGIAPGLVGREWITGQAGLR